MLQSMRNKIKGFVAFFLIALLTIPLALVGVENLFYGNNNVGEVAEVNGSKITETEVQIALRREKQRLQQQLGANLPADYVSDERLRPPVIEGLIRRALVASVAEEGGMTFSNEVIDKKIIEIPDFQVDGVFNSQRFVQIVRSLGYTPVSFKKLLKEDLAVDQMQSAVLSSDFVTDAEIGKTIALSRQTRDFSWITLPLGELPETMTVSDEEVLEHYEQNKSNYLSEEQVAIEYIDLNISELEKDITIDEESIREQYEQVVKSYSASTEREAAHIMIEGDDEASQKKIAELQEKLAAGEDFASLAGEYSDDFGTRDNGGNLGISSGDGFPEAFEKALVNLTEGQVSEATKIDSATHFIKLLKLIEKKAPPYEEQRVVIEAELKRAKAEERFVDDVQTIEELAYNAESLQEVGDELGISVQKTALFSRKNSTETITQDSRVLNAAFSEQVVQEGHSSDLLEISADRSVVIKMIDHKPVRTLGLEEKRESILAELKLEKAKVQLAEQAKSIREQLDQGADIEAVSKKEGVSLSAQLAAQRNTADVPKELRSFVFEMSNPEEGKATIGENYFSNGDYAIISLTKVTNGSMEALETAERASLRSNLSASIANDEYDAWQAQLQERGDVEVYSTQAPASY